MDLEKFYRLVEIEIVISTSIFLKKKNNKGGKSGSVMLMSLIEQIPSVASR